MLYHYTYFQPTERERKMRFIRSLDDVAQCFFRRVYEGEVEAPTPETAAEWLFTLHNSDARPLATEIPSMSVGDVLVLSASNDNPLDTHVLVCLPGGFAYFLTHAFVAMYSTQSAVFMPLAHIR